MTDRPNDRSLASCWPTLSLIITAVAVLVPGIMFGQIAFAEPLAGFKYFGVSAAIVATIAAALRLCAHRGNIHLDGLGKGLGFAAALLALFATLALMYIETTLVS